MPKPNGVHAIARRTHENQILAVLREHGALSRGDIALRVGLSRSTLSQITGDLVERGAIIVIDTDAAGRVGSGRPAELLALDPASGQFMGVDLGHRRVNVVVADASHEIIASGTRRYAESSEWSERITEAFDLIDQLAVETGVHFSAVQAVGIGVPGWGDRSVADGVGDAFAARLGAAIIVDNNARFAGLAEAMVTRASLLRDLVYVRLSDGVGGGLIVDGRLVRGSSGFAGELGHVTVVPDGEPCRCGKRGCVETVASVPAILARCRAEGLEIDSLDDLKAAIAVSHPKVEIILRNAGRAVGRALGAAAMTLNPTDIVIGGDVVAMAPALLQQVQSTVAYELSWRATESPTVRAADLGDEGGALGAVAAVFHQSPLLAGYPEAAGTLSGTAKEQVMTAYRQSRGGAA